MVNRLGNVRLIDHGRAVVNGEKMRFLLGSPLYMAPETHEREPSMTQSDLYAVGLVGLEMLRGETLVSDPDMDETGLLELKRQLPTMLNDLLPGYVQQNLTLMQILTNLLNPDPTRRYANAAHAESRHGGLTAVHRQLTQAEQDSDYDRDLEEYLSRLVNPATDRVEERE